MVEEEVNWVGGGSGVEVGKVVIFRWKRAQVFAVKCGSYGGSGGEVLGGLRR